MSLKRRFIRIKIFTLILCLLSLFFTCSLNDIIRNDEKSIADVNGLNFILKDGIPSNVMRLEPQLLIDDLKEITNRNNNSTIIPITLEEIKIIILDLMGNKYPVFSTDSIVSDMAIIKQDFFNIADEIIAEHINDIALAYEKQLRYEVYTACKNLIKIKTNSRASSSDSLPELTPNEITLLLIFPWNAPGYAAASAEATLAAETIYGGNINNTKANAFTHSFWCNCICYNCRGTSLVGTRSDRVNFARQMTNAHEQKDSGESTVMDLHNNDIGITYFNNNCPMSRILFFLPETVPSVLFLPIALVWCNNRANNAYYYPNPSQLSSYFKDYLKSNMILIYISN